MPRPVQFKRCPKTFGCCFVWTGREGKLVICCAHCSTVAGKSVDVSETMTEALLRLQVKRSQEAHAKSCRRQKRR